MGKPILYCDCDGVIFNTIDIAYEIMKQHGCDMSDKEIDYYFRKIIDWQDIIRKSTVINDSINKIKELKASGLFDDVIILTLLSGNYDEERLKRNKFEISLPDIKIITLQYGIQKSSILANPEKHILVDDKKSNCSNWQNSGGTAILFSQDENDLENNIINDLVDIPNTEGYKKLIKTRYF